MAKDRIKNYAQATSEINILKDIRTDLSVTPSSYTPDTSTVTRDRLVTFAQAEEELAVLGDIEKGVKQQVTEVDIAQKDIANIKALLQGNLYDYQTDTTSAYTKTVPSGAMPYAGLEQIGGKTVVWNQLCDILQSIESQHGVTFTINDGVITTSGTADDDFFVRVGGFTQNANASVGDKLLFKMTPTGTAETFYTMVAKPYWSEVYSSLLFTKSANTSDQSIRLYIKSGTNMDGKQISFVGVNLTKMFGSGNEPSTVEEFQQMFPADYYAYNAGTLLSAGVTSIFSDGQNLINPANFTTNGVSYSDGVITVDVGDKNYRDIYAGTQYTGTAVPVAYIPKLPFLMPGTYTFAMDSYTGDQFRLSVYTVAENGSVTQITNGVSINGTTVTFDKPTRITLRSRYSSIITNLRLTKTDSAVPYKPYFSETYPIPTAIRNLEGYGWSAGSVYNYVDFERKVFVQNVGKLVIDGDANIKYVSAVGSMSVGIEFYLPSPGKIFSYTQIGNFIDDSGYTHMNGYTSAHEAEYINNISSCIAINHNGAYITIYEPISHNITDAASAKAYYASNPLTVYYELETPIETDISEYITDDNLINVGAGGTLTFPNQNGTDYQIPVPSEEEYMIDLQEALS